MLDNYPNNFKTTLQGVFNVMARFWLVVGFVFRVATKCHYESILMLVENSRHLVEKEEKKKQTNGNLRRSTSIHDCTICLVLFVFLPLDWI